MTNRSELVAASDIPMRGREFLRLATRLGIDPTVTYELTIAPVVAAIGENDPIEAIVTEYVTDDDGLIRHDDDGDLLKTKRVIVLRSLELRA